MKYIVFIILLLSLNVFAQVRYKDLVPSLQAKVDSGLTEPSAVGLDTSAVDSLARVAIGDSLPGDSLVPNSGIGDGTGRVSVYDTAYFGKRVGIGRMAFDYPLEIFVGSGSTGLKIISDHTQADARPGIEQWGLRTPGSGVAFDLFKLYIGSSEANAETGGIFGFYGGVNASAPHIHYYLYMDARTTAAYNSATLKIDVNNRVGIALSGTQQPATSLDVEGNSRVVSSSIENLFKIHRISNSAGVRAAMLFGADDLAGYSKGAIIFQRESGVTNGRGYFYFALDSNDDAANVNSGDVKMILDYFGRLNIGTTGSTAYLHLRAGSATAGFAPFKFTSGTNLTVPEAGAMEFNGTRLFFTPSATRETIAFLGEISDSLQILKDSIAVHREELDALNTLSDQIEGYHLAYVTNEKVFSGYDTLLFQTTTDTANTVPNSPAYLRLRAGTKTVDPDSGIWFNGSTYYTIEWNNSIHATNNDTLTFDLEFCRMGTITADRKMFSFNNSLNELQLESDSTLRLNWNGNKQPTGTYERGVFHKVRVSVYMGIDTVEIDGQKFGGYVTNNLPISRSSAASQYVTIGATHAGASILTNTWIRNIRITKKGTGVQEVRFSPSAAVKFIEARKNDTNVTITQDQSYLEAYNIFDIDFTGGNANDFQQTEIYYDMGTIPVGFKSFARDAFYVEYKITGDATFMFAGFVGGGCVFVSDTMTIHNSWQYVIINRDRLALGKDGHKGMVNLLQTAEWEIGSDRIELRIIVMGKSGGQVLIKNVAYRYLTNSADVATALQTGACTTVDLSTPILTLAAIGDMQYTPAQITTNGYLSTQLDSIFGYDSGTDFIIAPGDNSQNDSTVFWMIWDTLKARGYDDKLLTTVGNHDEWDNIGGTSKKSAVKRFIDSTLVAHVTAGRTLGSETYTNEDSACIGYVIDLVGDSSIFLIGFDEIVEGTAPTYFATGADTTWLAGKIDSILALNADALIFMTEHAPKTDVDGSYPVIAGMTAAGTDILRTMLANKNNVKGVFSGHNENTWATSPEEGGIVYVEPSQLARRPLGWQACYVDIFASGYVRYSLEWFDMPTYETERELYRNLPLRSPANNRYYWYQFARNVIQKP